MSHSESDVGGSSDAAATPSSGVSFTKPTGGDAQPTPGFLPPGYAPPGYTPPGFLPPGYAPPGYAPPGYTPPGYGQSAYSHPGAPMDPAWAAYYAMTAPRPGSIPLRPLSLGDILDGAFRTVRRNPKATLGPAAVVGLLQAIILAVFLLASRTVSSDTTTVSPFGTNSGGGLAGTLLSRLASLILAAILSGLLTIVVTDDVLGKRIELSEVWARARPRLARLIGVSFLVSVVEVIGLIFLIAPGVWLWGIWAVAVPALMVEDVTIRGALGRSRTLVEGMFWRVWGVRALGVLVVSVVTTLLALPFTLAGGFVAGASADSGGHPVIVVLLLSIGTIVGSTLGAPLRAGIDALLYVDQRMRREGMDIVLQQQAVSPAAGR